MMSTVLEAKPGEVLPSHEHAAPKSLRVMGGWPTAFLLMGMTIAALVCTGQFYYERAPGWLLVAGLLLVYASYCLAQHMVYLWLCDNLWRVLSLDVWPAFNVAPDLLQWHIDDCKARQMEVMEANDTLGVPQKVSDMNTRITLLATVLAQREKAGDRVSHMAHERVQKFGFVRFRRALRDLRHEVFSDVGVNHRGKVATRCTKDPMFLRLPR